MDKIDEFMKRHDERKEEQERIKALLIPICSPALFEELLEAMRIHFIKESNADLESLGRE